MRQDVSSDGGSRWCAGEVRITSELTKVASDGGVRPGGEGQEEALSLRLRLRRRRRRRRGIPGTKRSSMRRRGNALECIEEKKKKGNEKENGRENVGLETLGSEKRGHFPKETEVWEVELQRKWRRRL